MTASILPTASELAGITTLEEARRWAGSRDPAWGAWQTAVGQVPSLRVLANIATSAFKETLALVRIASTSGGDPRELSVVEAIQLALVWRVARQAYGMEDVDPLADLGSGSPSSPAAGTSVTSPPSAKRVKAASVIDQLDESDVPLLTQAQLDEAYRHHAEVTGADPPADAEPTGEQIAALKTRVVDRGESPYADFSVLTPYGRRVQKQMKARSWLLQQDGTFRALDVPGPPSFDTWAACWKVYRSALFMLRYPPHAAGGPLRRVVTAACLEEYFERITKLNAEFPETWHLLMQAEDRCRSEMFERYRRQLCKAAIDGKLPMGLDFSASEPWIGVFTHAARDSAFWDEHVVRPAQNFIARGGKQMTMDKASRATIPEPAQEIIDRVNSGGESPPGLPGQGQSKAAKRRRRDKEARERWAAQPTPGPSWSSWSSWDHSKGDGNSGGKPHQKAKGGLYSTNSDGVEICYKFAKGPANSCPEPCKEGRDHACQICLGRHPNAQCPRASKGSGKSKDGSGGGKNKWKK